MKINKFLLLAFLAAILMYSCSSDDDDNGMTNDGGDNPPESVPTDYTNGFLVLNEGGGGAPGSVTYVNSDLDSVQQRVYHTVNGGDIGQFAQSIFFGDGRTFIISNGSNLITVVDSHSFEKIGVIDSGLNVPRYGVAEDDKAYVTNQADFNTNTDDFIAVIDLQSLTVENTVVLGDYADYITNENGKLYVQNAAFGMGNHISVFNPETNAIENTIQTADSLNSFAVEDNTIYALSPHKLQRIDLGSGTVSSAINLNYGSTPQHLQIEEGTAYFTVGTAVYSFPVSGESAPQTPVFSYQSNSDFGAMYGFAVEDAKIYVADGGDFASDSFIEVHDLNGNLVKKIDVGIAPNGFYFN